MLAFLLKYPRAVGIGIAVIVIGGYVANYKYMQNKIDRLEVEKVAFETALARAADNMLKMEVDARIAAEATATVIAERNAARHALDDLRRGRENDPESATWGAEPIPIGEITRLCRALPNLEGCPNE